MELTTRESLSALLRGALKGLAVLLLSFLCVYLLNAKMGAFLDEEREAQRLALRMGTVDIITPEAAQGKLDYHYEGKFNEIYEQNIKADVIFLGTSHIAHGLNPKFLEDEDGVRYFNFAFNGACPTYFKFWYNDVFLASGYPKPKAIIYGVEWFMFDDGWLWRREEMDYKYMRDTKPVQIEDIKEQITDIDSLLTFVFNKTPIIYARDRFFDMFKPIYIAPSKAVDNAGFKPVYDSNGNNTTSYYNGFIAWEANYDGSPQNTGCNDNPQAIKDFKELIEQIQAEGIPLILVQSPEYISGRKVNGYGQHLKIIQDIAEEYNLPFINYITGEYYELNDDVSLFSDWGHLNSVGAEKYTKQLKEDLAKILPDIIK